MSVRLVLINLGIAVAYLALGRLGLLLSLPPGYATAIWPPAGLACGACLIWRARRIGPGIFVGSALTNSLVSGHFSLDALAVVIALGSTLQAAFGEQLLRRVDPMLSFDSSGRVARFSGAVALASLIAASIGNAGLVATGAIGHEQFMQSFVTWWAGDALGMQIFTPMTLLLLDPREIWRERRIPVGMPLLLVFLLCGLVYGYVRNQEEEQLRSQFGDEAEIALAPLREIDDVQIQNLGNLVTFFYASNEVLPQEFSTFAARMIRSRRGFRALEWAPLVPPGGEAAYGRQTEHLLGRALPIVSAPDGGEDPGLGRVPVTYVEPLAGNESALGLDLNSEASRRELLMRAMQSDHVVVSSRITLKQDPDGPGGVLLVQALRDAAGQVTGFCIGILDLRQLVASFRRDPGLEWRLVDLSAGGAPLVVSGSLAGAPVVGRVILDRAGLHYSAVLPIADRHWQLTLHRPLSSVVAPHFSSSLLILFFAFATCGALGNVALSTSGERRRIADEVRHKTMALSEEVEQRQLLERELRESEQRYRRALDVAQLGSWSFDPVSRRIHFDQWSQLHHGVVEEWVGVEQFLSILHPEDRQAITDRVRDHLDPSRSGAAVERFELRIVDAGGRVRVLEVTAQPELEDTPDARQIRVVTGTSRDITDRRQYEDMQRVAREEAEKSVRTRAEFVANMSHELRTPMNGILGMVALALGTRLTLQQREYLLLVQESAQSLLRLLNDILDFSKMDAGKLELEPTEFDVRDLLGSTLQRMAEAAHAKGLDLQLHVAAAVPRMLRGDQQRLMQVLINLVSNATKFTESGEVVVLVQSNAQPEGRVELHVSVRDTGTGIAPAAQQRIFEPFAQADSSITRRFGGTGLGLSICRQIIALFHGRMWVESEPGHGSTFHFTARLDDVAGPAVPDPQRERLRGRHAVIVAGSHTAAGILEELLRSWHMHALVCTDTAQVADSVAAMSVPGGEPALFLVDLHAGGVFAGEQLSRQVRQRCGPAVRIVAMLSAVEPPDVAIRCYQAGIDATVHLPIREVELIEALLPAVVETEGRGSAPRGAASLPPPSGVLKILVAEDYPVNQKIAVALLESRGHQVTLAENGRQAVEFFQQQAFDLILMDVQMPEMDGLAATRRIRELETGTGRHIRIVAVTASAHTGERERLLAAGMDDYLAKPYSLPGLVTVVEPNGDELAEAANAVIVDELEGNPAQSSFDKAEALARCMNSPSLLARVVATFTSTQGEIRNELREAIQRDDRSAVEHWAHRLKGGAATLSAAAGAGAAAALEGAAHSADRTTLAALMVRVDTEIERLLTLLTAL